MTRDREMCPRVPDAVALLATQAHATPDRLAVDFVDGMGRRGGALSYAALDRAARAVAGALVARLAPGARVVLAYPPGVGFVAAFFGCLYAGMVAVPVALPRSEESDETDRFRHVIDDAGCTAVLAPPEVARRLAGSQQIGRLIDSLWLGAADSAPPIAALHAPDPEDVAFLQYTSGSTGAPKGVMVRHRNIVHNAHRIMVRCRLDATSRALIWLPHFHDLGLVGGILVPLYAGFPSSLMSPMAFVKRPLGWLRLVSDGGYTISGGPNFAFKLCVERLDPARLTDVDLSGWRCAFNCAEPIEAATVRDFADAFAPWGFRRDAIYPCYGMAEATLTMASHHGPREVKVFGADADMLEQRGRAEPARADGRRRDVVAVGRAAPDQVLAVVDRDRGTACAPGVVGEIWSADPSNAAGYWQRAAQSRDTFEATLPDWPGRRFLRTGDLGFLLDGELYVTGRLKDVVIVDGRNLHAEDIEATAKRAAGSGATLAAAAFSVGRPGGGEVLVVIVEVERRAAGEVAVLRRRIQAALVARHELGAADILLVNAGRIPRTTSGKVRRRETRALHARGAFADATPTAVQIQP